MVARKKTQTVNIDNWNSAVESNHTMARNLHKNDLGGVIFGCKHSTMPECLSKQLFGLPSSHFSYARNIEPGLPLFLFNYSDRKLHGIYESASHGQMNIDAYAWTDSGAAERTAFPAQVRILVKVQCMPLVEKEFKKIIEDNYYTPQHFWFELDHAQTSHLIALFKPVLPALSLSQTNHFPELASTKWKPKKDIKATSSTETNKSAALDLYKGDTDFGGPSNASSCFVDQLHSKQLVSDREELAACDLDRNNPGIVTKFDGVDEILEQQAVDEDDYKNILLKLNMLSANCKLTSSSRAKSDHTSSFDQGCLLHHNEQHKDGLCNLLDNDENVDAVKIHHENVVSDSQLIAVSVSELHHMASEHCDENSNGNSGEHLNVSSNLGQVKEPTCAHLSHGILLETVRELKMCTASLEMQQVESDKQMQHLRNQHENAGRKLQMLGSQLKKLEAMLGTSLLLDGHMNKFVEQNLGIEDAIYLIGGYHSSAWLSSLDSFSPYLDILTSLNSMSSIRVCASAVALNGFLYAIGGGVGKSWYNTVERYDRRFDEWTSCPSMIQARGCLAAATSDGKIYAIGGGDGLELFSNVEMFDPALGRWVSWLSMFHKRLNLAAAELNGILYAVGGYDGHGYLKSAERLDPRTSSWTRLPDMSSRREGHSIAVLNEKLYAMGGYDGDNMLSSVEVYDPRANAWMDVEPMHIERGYAASAVLGNSIFAIAGLKEAENYVETIEYYREGAGWERSRLKAVGRRCHFSAVVL